MSKVKFEWKFKISEDQQELEIFLNEGINTILEINHDSFHKNLSEKLHEIMHHQHVIGTKTFIQNLNVINQANEIRSKGVTV